MTTANVEDGLPFPDFASMLPRADRASLAGLTTAEIRSWTAARADEYRSFALALLTICNTVAPIHCLPNEVLSRVIAHSWHDRNSLRLAHVCRRWRSVVLATPEFWVNAARRDTLTISARRPRDLRGYIAALLERSGNHAIEPSFDTFDSTLHGSLGPHLWRIRSLTVRGFHTVEDVAGLFRLLRNGMPALETLVIPYQPPQECDCETSECGFYGSEDEDFVADALLPALVPRLRHIEVPSFTFPQLAVPSLEHVDLQRDTPFHGNPGMHCGELLSALRQCPAISTLKLSTVLLSDEPPDEASLVPLPSLTTLRISDEGSRVALLLRYLLCSPAHIHVCEYQRNNPADNWLRSGPASASLAVVDRVDMDSSYTGSTVVRCYAEGAERLYSLSERGIFRFADIFRNSPVTTLALCQTGFGPGQCRPLLRDLVHLTRLMLHGEDVWEVLNDLLPRANRPGQDEVACRYLQELVLGFCSDIYPAADAVSGGETVAPEVLAKFIERCSQIETSLSALASHGIRLKYLEMYESNSQTPNPDPSSFTVLHLTAVHWSRACSVCEIWWTVLPISADSGSSQSRDQN